MSQLNCNDHFSCERGSAIFEFAVISPIMLLIVLMMVELGFHYQYAQNILNVSWEVSNAVLRECETSSQIESCISSKAPEIENYLTTQVPNFENLGVVVISMYSLSNKLGEVRIESADSVMKDSPTLLTVDLLGDALAKDITVATEIFYRRTSILPTSGIFSSILPKDYYDAVIM